MNWKRSIKIAGLWLTLSNVPVKKRNSRKVGDRDDIDSTFRMKDLRREVKAAQGSRCQMCGEVSERMELHHILPLHVSPSFGTTDVTAWRCATIVIKKSTATRGRTYG